MGELINIKIIIKENINLKELIEKIKNELDTKNGYKLPIENPVMESTKSI
ncbi:hypothetical protein KST94_09630 [Fusobacterium nucleatum]|nr:hypothetical protein [Fusobacterium nucleatum]